MGQRVTRNAKRGAQRRWKRTLRRHPGVGVLASVLLAVLAVVLLVGGLLAENALYYLATALSGLGSAAIARARRLEAQRQEQLQANRSAGQSQPKPQRPERGGLGGKSTDAPSGPLRCTDTGKPIEGDEKCGCASRHVATAEGARRYGLPVGSPLGKRTKPGKPASTTRSNA